MNLSISSIALLLGAAQGIFLGLILIRKRRQHIANIFLAILMIFYSFFILQVMVIVSGLDNSYPHLVPILDGFPLLFGPLHYLYARFLSGQVEKIDWKQAFHFLPFLLYRFYFIDVFFISSADLAAFIETIKQGYKPIIFEITSWVIAVQGLTYMVLTLFVIRRFEFVIRETFSAIERLNFNWLRNITYLTMFVWFFVLLESILLIFDLELLGQETNLIALLTAIIIYVLGYMGLHKSEVFSQHPLPDSYTNENIAYTKSDTEKYSKSGLTEEKAHQYAEQLINFITNEKPYKNSTLTLKEISEKLDISMHNLSQVINTVLRLNFFDFINAYRVEQVKKDLSNPGKNNLKILAIAYDAGFNSKTSFYNIFKKYTGLTPLEYRRQFEEKYESK